jgi:hypothetical protein
MRAILTSMIKKSANRTPLILHDSLEEEKRERERE